MPEFFIALGVIVLIVVAVLALIFFLLGLTDGIQGRSRSHAQWVAEALPPILWHAWIMGYGLVGIIANRIDFEERKRNRTSRRAVVLDKLEDR